MLYYLYYLRLAALSKSVWNDYIYSTFFQAAFWFTTAYPIGSLKTVYSPSACSHQMQFGFHQPVVARVFVECEAEF